MLFSWERRRSRRFRGAATGSPAAWKPIVDRSLSRLFRSEEFQGLYVKWFGVPDETTLNHIVQNALPE